jgi:hypothetical protein
MRPQSASMGSAEISLLTYYHSLNAKTRLAIPVAPRDAEGERSADQA